MILIQRRQDIVALRLTLGVYIELRRVAGGVVILLARGGHCIAGGVVSFLPDKESVNAVASAILCRAKMTRLL